MKLTNDLGLPLPLVKAVENDPYDNGDTLSVTTLLKPPQAYAISLERQGELVEDVSDRIWALTGQIGHVILERAALSLDPLHYISEQRFAADIAGKRVSGQVDLIEKAEGVVWDYKLTSAWSVVGGGKDDWRIQLSLLAMLARMNGIEVKSGKICAILRDWTALAALRNREWPEKSVAVLDMDIMSHDEALAWTENRIREFDEAVAGRARACSDEERWHKPGKWAVYKGTNQKAAKLEDTEEELSSWIFANRAKLGANYRIEQRQAEYRRCQSYCAAAPFCPQYQATLKPSLEEALEIGDGLPYKPQLDERY